jgi:[ribosomal protein S5]-alanine N-acetyltransferase
MEIQTNRLLLMPCTPENYITYSKHYLMGPHINMYIEQLAEDPFLKGWGVWLVLRQDSRQVIGDMGFKGKPDERRTVEIGYGILPESQNQGFATEAVGALQEWAFSTGLVDKITAECLEENIPSIKVLKKAGMQHLYSAGGLMYWEKICP